jgi:hypothetical protein
MTEEILQQIVESITKEIEVEKEPHTQVVPKPESPLTPKNPEV